MENPAPDVEKTESGRSDEETPERRTRPLPGLQKAGEKRRSPEAAPFRNRSRAGAHRNNPVHSHEATISSRATGGFPGKERVTPERRIPEGKTNRASCADRSTPCFRSMGRRVDRIASDGSVRATAEASEARNRSAPIATIARPRSPPGIRGLPAAKCLPGRSPERKKERGEQEHGGARDPSRFVATRVVDHRAPGLRSWGRRARRCW